MAEPEGDQTGADINRQQQQQEAGSPAGGDGCTYFDLATQDEFDIEASYCFIGSEVALSDNKQKSADSHMEAASSMCAGPALEVAPSSANAKASRKGRRLKANQPPKGEPYGPPAVPAPHWPHTAIPEGDKASSRTGRRQKNSRTCLEPNRPQANELREENAQPNDQEVNLGESGRPSAVALQEAFTACRNGYGSEDVQELLRLAEAFAADFS